MAESSGEATSSSGGSIAVESTTLIMSSEGTGTGTGPAASPVSPIREELEKPEEFLEPERKRRKLPALQAAGAVGQDGLPLLGKPVQKLEHRLGGILCCVVCFDLPRAAVYQVFMNSFLI
jgi:hypothetical protein